MRVLYILNDFSIGGAEKGLLHLIEQDFFDKADLTIVSLFKGNGMLLKELNSKKITGGIHSIMPQNKMTIPKLLAAFFKLAKFIKKTSPGMVICSLEQANILGRIAAKMRGKCIVVSFEHSTFYSKSYYYPLLKWTFPLVDAVLYDSARTRDSMQPYYKKNVPWLYAPLVSVDITNQTHNYKARNTFTILSVGRLAKVKNLGESIRAIKLLADRGYNIKFNIVGCGDIERELRGLAQELNVEDKILFLGYMANWSHLCGQADIFLHTSLYEGLCISVIEAMATGIPVVATDVGGIKDYGRNGKNMIKIEGFDAAHIADAIETMIKSEQLREDIGKTGQGDIDSLFNIEKTKDRLRVVFSGLEGLAGNMKNGSNYSYSK